MADDEGAYGNYDWIADYQAIRQFLTPEFLEVGLDARLLIVGCGTSTLSENLYASGFHNIVNVDIDAKQIELMRSVHADKPGMSWIVADLCDARSALPADGSFDVAIDKGTLDALLCTDQAAEAPPTPERPSTPLVIPPLSHRTFQRCLRTFPRLPASLTSLLPTVPPRLAHPHGCCACAIAELERPNHARPAAARL
jgi:SAM-dependent methyltransferase